MCLGASDFMEVEISVLHSAFRRYVCTPLLASIWTKLPKINLGKIMIRKKHTVQMKIHICFCFLANR